MNTIDAGLAITPPHTPYPPIEPYATHQIEVGDGHTLYVEECGNPEGKPAVFLHGGPGGASSVKARQFFDPELYRIVLFDQRGCGRSTPLASEPEADLSAITTWTMVADIEVIREALGVETWLVFGGSWGSTLALAYAETYPERVTELVLRGIFMLRKAELDWMYNGPGASAVFPDHWESYVKPLGGDTEGRAIERYHNLLFDPDPEVHGPAGVAWTVWEARTTTLQHDDEHAAHYEVPSFALAFARLENHVFFHRGWLQENQLIDGVDAIRDIPCVIVQGRYDMCCPATSAWDLHRAWPEADLRMVLAGHSAFEPLIASELVAATDRFAGKQ